MEKRFAKGFTLLEILVAFVVFGIVGSTLLQLFQSGLNHIDRSHRISHAALLAQSKLTELGAVRTFKPGEYQGEFKGGYRWHLSLTPYSGDEAEPLPEANLEPFKAELSITWEPRGEYRLQTLFASKTK